MRRVVIAEIPERVTGLSQAHERMRRVSFLVNRKALKKGGKFLQRVENNGQNRRVQLKRTGRNIFLLCERSVMMR
ncbi:hypothetical protein CSB45_08775 [candidate division KSB3 bacterium]|uniref:Uncharacterized protein n=1 Tax=candidate division KSB3 bacterium TaxID=2044937 RepID=A0A2G6E5E5_9BACT|nr:MAG: hypothetical protein CSB45_08775 [candidate division KSB3 bacterium]PIE29685.1 MAG: hypothetical protein CSA57_07660 [candidate division KSB3 bacterium]